MINTLLYRILLAIPTMLGVAVICFMLVQIAPGDPLVSVMPPDASESLRQTLMQAYGFDKPLPLQFVHWLWRALHGDLGMSVATGRPVIDEVMTAVTYSLRLALLATAIGFVLGSLFGFVAGYFRNSIIDRLASVLSVFGVSVPHYWLGMLLVIVSETSATSTLKMFGSSEGITKMLLLGLLVLLYCTCYYSLSRAVKDIPVGLAYATWSGTGILVVSTLGMAFYGQHPDTAAIIGMAVIASGIVIMNLFSKMGSEESEEAPAEPSAASSLDKKVAN